MSPPRLYLRYISYSLRAQLSYRASFILHALSQFLVTIAEFFGLVTLYARFGNITSGGTWTLPQIAVLYGLSDTAFAIAESVPRGFDVLPTLIKSGDFDRLLLRPRSPAFQVLASELQLMRLGRLSQGIAILTWGIVASGVTVTPAHIALILFALLGGACLFAGLFVLGATLAFWTTESLEVVNIATYGGSYAAQYPLTIYRPWFRIAITFVLPLATINYFPAHALFGRPETAFHTPTILQVLSPLSGFVFLALTLQIWRLGIRRYTSTGS